MPTEKGNIFDFDEAQRLWEEHRQRVAAAAPEETIEFCDTVFEEDPKGEYFHNIIFHSEVDFSGATFLHSTVFSKALFEQDVIFENCKFPEGGIFMFTEFHGDAEFENVVFEDKARFAGVVFKQDANFSGSAFNAMAAFESEESSPAGEHKKTEFQYFANFDKCIWKEYVQFLDVIFRDDACFKNGTFEYELNFKNCNIIGKADFEAADFMEYSGRKDKRRNRVRFLHNSFDGNVSFWNARFNCPAKFVDNYFDDQVEFRKACFNKSVLIDRTNKFHGRLYLDISYKSFSRPGDSIEPYRLAKKTAHEACDSKMEGIYHFQEQCAANKKERISITIENFKKRPLPAFWNFSKAWFGYFIGNWIFGYGEKWSRPLLAGAIVILIFAALFFSFGGINYGSLPVDNPTQTGVKQMAFEAAEYPLVECRLEDGPPRDWSYAGNCMYFSVVTFTTLGYGDFHPYPKMRWLSATEAAFGAALMAMFIVSLSRKFVR